MGILFISLLFGAVFAAAAFIAGVLFIDIYWGAVAGFITFFGASALLGLVLTVIKAYDESKTEKYIKKHINKQTIFSGDVHLIAENKAIAYRLFLTEEELLFVKFRQVKQREDLTVMVKNIKKALMAPIRTGQMEGVRLMLHNGQELLFTMMDHAKFILTLRDEMEKDSGGEKETNH